MLEYFKLQNDIITTLINALPFGTVASIYLIGSYAKGTNIYSSDIDLIMVSNCFEQICGYLRSKIVLSCMENDDPRIDVICLTEKEFCEYKKSDAFHNESIKLLYGEEP